MELLKTIVNLVFVLQFVLPITVNNLVVFGSEISCEVSEATNGSCTRTVVPCNREHDGERQQCFGDGATEVPSTCPLVEGYPIGDCRNQHDEYSVTDVVPDSVNLTAYPIYPGPGQLFGLRVTWSPSSDFATDTNLQGYQLKLKYSDDRTSIGGCVCKSYTETEHNFTLPYGDPRQLRVTVTSYPEHSDANAVERVFTVPKSCYDLPYDPIHCGQPRYSKPSNVKVHSTLTSNGTMSAKISWEPPQFDASASSEYPIPSTYYLYLRWWNPQKRNWERTETFIASSTEAVSIHSLNITDHYIYIEVQAYVKCSGYGGTDDGFNGCGYRSQVRIPSPTFISLSSVTASMTSVSESVSTSTAATIIRGEPSSHGNRNMLFAVIGGAVGFVVVATVIIAGLVVIRRRKGYWCRNSGDSRNVYSDSSGDSSQRIGLLSDSETPQNSLTVWECPFTPSPTVLPPVVISNSTDTSSDLKMVFLLYSPKSPIVEVNVILERIYKSLRRYIAVIIPGDYTRGLNPAEWLSNRMCRANVVLCVCNATFKSEWNRIRQPSIEVNTLKELVSGAIYCHSGESSLSSKYATVCLKQSDYHCIPALLSGTSRFLMDETDKMVAFTTETPRYAAKS